MAKKETNKEEVIDKKRYRNFMVLFYNENERDNFDQVLFNIHGLKYFAYIKHEPETDEKSSHYHGFIHLDSATTEEALAKRLDIPKNHVEYVKNVRSGCRYLTHIDYPEKIQYDLNDVKVSRLFQRKFLSQFEDIKTEEEIIQDIYYWIDNFHYDNYHEKLKYFIMYINLNCYDTIFKRYRYELTDYLKHTL